MPPPSTPLPSRSPVSADPLAQQRTPGLPHYLSALDALERPVPDLASTLGTHPDDVVDAENVAFLRRRYDPQEEWSADNAQRSQRQESRVRAEEERLRRERLQRILERLDRAHRDVGRQQSQPSMFDPPPPPADDDEEELQEILHELRQQQPHTHPEVLRVLARSQLDAERETRARANERTAIARPPTGPSESSLRSTAILQSVRRHPRFSARSRDYMQRYIMDRERYGHDGEEADRHQPARTFSDAAAMARRFEQSGLNLQNLQNQERSSGGQSSLESTRARIDAYRRSYLENPTTTSTPTPSPWLEETIKYLSHLRNCYSCDDVAARASEAGLCSKDFFDDSDFVTSIEYLPPPAESSWLAPGAVFSGSQHATNPSSFSSPPSASANATTTTYRLPNNESLTSTVIESGIPRRSSSSFDPSRPFDAARPWLSHTPPTYIPRYDRQAHDSPPANSGTAGGCREHQQDRWPVKVTIHSVDYDSMTLAATMEAYNVPSHPVSISNITTTNNANTTPSSPSSTAPTHLNRPSPSPDRRTSSNSPVSGRSAARNSRSSSITTYLEGEILDFRQHTFLTETFASTTAHDAAYWRKLEPFARFTDEQVVKNLVSKEWMRWLSEHYVLMRWKEKCFVKPTGLGSGSQSTSGAIPDQRRGSWGREGWRRRGEEEMQYADDGCGLTISGFYYVCLRRSDGAVEGLYHDNFSSPYQHLRLDSVGRGGFPVWEFR